jgi:hypothetical protein
MGSVSEIASNQMISGQRSIEQLFVRPFGNFPLDPVLPRSKKYIPWPSFDDPHGDPRFESEVR